MINHLYIDYYRCFINFEWKPGQLVLLLGTMEWQEQHIRCYRIFKCTHHPIPGYGDRVGKAPGADFRAWPRGECRTVSLPPGVGNIVVYDPGDITVEKDKDKWLQFNVEDSDAENEWLLWEIHGIEIISPLDKRPWGRTRFGSLTLMAMKSPLLNQERASSE